MKVLKGQIIKNIDFSSEYYQRLQQLAFFLSEQEEAKYHLETILILINTLDLAADKQGLIEEIDLDIISDK